MDYKTNFKDLFSKIETQEFIKKALDIKKADRNISKKLKWISVISCIGMAVLGYVAFGAVGSILFLLITYISSFSLTLSMKKKALMAYLKHYRENLLKCLAGAEKIDKPSEASWLNMLYPDTLHHWTVCYTAENVAVGFSRIYKGTSEIANGMAACAAGKGTEGRIFKGFFPTLAEDYVEERASTGFLPEGAEEFAKVLEKHFNSYAMLFSDKYSLLFLPTASDFMTGRVEDSDDVSPRALARQFAYVNIAVAFETLDASVCDEVCELFECDLSSEEEIYKSMKERK